MSSKDQQILGVLAFTATEQLDDPIPAKTLPRYLAISPSVAPSLQAAQLIIGRRRNVRERSLKEGRKEDLLIPGSQQG